MVAEQAADVIVVGAGPAGSTAAYHLAQAGLDVLVLEKTTFPREKVCGDGLTPRAVHSLIAMGVSTDEKDGWIRNKGLRVIGGGLRLELPWPELASWPDYGLVRPRLDFDETLVRHAEKAGARLREQVTVTGPVLDRTGRVVGVEARTADGPATFSAPLVLAADGVSGRLALSLGIAKRDDRPMGVAVRRYYTSPRTQRRPPRVVAGALAHPAGRHPDPHARVRLDLRRRRRHLQRRARHPQLLRGVRVDGLPRPARLLARRPAGGVGVRRAERDRPGPRRRPADGLQPHPALLPRAAAGRRLGRRGQPVQRRGHRVRDGDRAAGRRARRASAGPTGRTRAGSGRWRRTRPRCGRPTAATTGSAGSS